MTINWATKVITVPKTDLTLVSGTFYTHDTDVFRLGLKALEDDEEGIMFPDTHKHATEVTVAGITYARVIEIINGYSVTYEDGQYSVRLEGSNNNIWDIENGILNQNQVQVIPTNSAGLIVKSIGSGLSTEEHDKIMTGLDATIPDAVLNELLTDHITSGSVGEAILLAWDAAGGRRVIDENTNQEIFYKADNTTEIMRFNLFDVNGNPTSTKVYERVRV